MVQQIFAQAIAAHTQGDLPRAEALYRQVLTLSPQHPDALHLLGRLACDTGNAHAALDLIGQAVRLRPRVAEYQASLAEAHRALGQVAEAAETYRRAARLKPESAPIQFGHGMALAAAGQPALAVQAFRRALARDPAMAAAHAALGAALLAQGQADLAVGSFRAAYDALPSDGVAAFNLGCALQAAGDGAGAEAAYRDALKLLPGHVPAQGNLSRVLQDAGRLEEAADILAAAVHAAPQDAALWRNFGLLLRELSRFDAAEHAFRQEVALAPSADALACLANTLRDQGRLGDAEAACRAAMAAEPDHREAHISLALTRLLAGDLVAGWPDFAWRGAAEAARARIAALVAAPPWRGEALDGMLLIYAEQGAGDFVQFSRFVARAAALARGVVLVVPGALRRLALSVPGATLVVTHDEAIPRCAACCADLDLPGIFGVSVNEVAVPVPYLVADAGDIAAWRGRLAGLPGRRVGIAWAGNKAYFHDRQRSIPAQALTALADLPGSSFVSLQPGAAAPAALRAADWTDELTDFADTAALIYSLDLVIAVDSAVAHLAGALGKPVWLLNRYAPDWRWGLGSDGSAWYPTLRQFRQPAPGDWAAVLANVRDALQVNISPAGASLP
jgi:tetratricopeptide (TPR) repeat protein